MPALCHGLWLDAKILNLLRHIFEPLLRIIEMNFFVIKFFRIERAIVIAPEI